MKKCPACAEEIQDAAIVCKHCQRDVVPAVTPTKKKAGPLKILLIIGGIFLAVYVLADRVQFNEFRERRAAWHAKCDQYQETPLVSANAEARACAAELDALMAEAKSEGWVQ